MVHTLLMVEQIALVFVVFSLLALNAYQVRQMADHLRRAQENNQAIFNLGHARALRRETTEPVDTDHLEVPALTPTWEKVSDRQPRNGAGA